MATWTTIADARLEPDKPARSIDAIAMRDNPIAIAENAPNAPKVEQYYALITVSGTWTVPKTGQYQIDIVGGGGNGAAGAAGAGGGGAGGGGGSAGDSIRLELSITQGDAYPLVIGALGGASSGFGVTMRGNARGGGVGGVGGGGGGGGGGEGAQPTFSATTAVVATAGGNGGGVFGGVGGVGGGVYGGGGGGGGGGYSAAGGAGGAGAQGAVIIRGI